MESSVVMAAKKPVKKVVKKVVKKAAPKKAAPKKAPAPKPAAKKAAPPPKKSSGKPVKSRVGGKSPVGKGGIFPWITNTPGSTPPPFAARAFYF